MFSGPVAAMSEGLNMALSKLEKILITIGVLGGVITVNAGINSDKDVLTQSGYLVTLASFGYALNKLYKRK